MKTHQRPSAPSPRPELSPAGAARRDAMLGELLGAMQRTHATRRTRRRIAATLVLVVVAAVSLWVTRPSPDPTPGDVAERSPEAPAATVAVKVLDDDALLAELAGLGRPTGLVRTHDRVWLTERVTDAELGIEWPAKDS